MYPPSMKILSTGFNEPGTARYYKWSDNQDTVCGGGE